jgi:hypothetical protein
MAWFKHCYGISSWVYVYNMRSTRPRSSLKKTGLSVVSGQVAVSQSVSPLCQDERKQVWGRMGAPLRVATEKNFRSQSCISSSAARDVDLTFLVILLGL